jgi:hypothetical protein
METVNIGELKPDNRNANKGRRRGAEAVEHSLKELGAGRSILIDRDGRVVAGNKTLAAAVAAGLQNVVIVESDGTNIIAVKRTDLSLDDAKGRKLAVADNRTAELGLEWEPSVLAELSTLDLKPFFTDAELSKIIAPDAVLEPGAKSGEVDVDAFAFAHHCPKCGFEYNE